MFNPITKVKSYFKSGAVKGDIIAGLVTGSVVVPQSMSYALLANLPPQIGLYSCIGLVVYAFIGSSPQLSVAPVAMASMLVGTATATAPDQSTAIDMALIIAFFAGVIQWALALTQLGEAITRWLSRTMLAGYTTGVAITIIFSQLPPAFGVKVPRSPYPIVQLIDFFAALPRTKPAAFIFFIVCLIVLLLFQKVLKRHLKPSVKFIADFGTMIVVVVGAASAYGLVTTYPAIQLPLVGNLPSGFMTPRPPPLDKTDSATIGIAVAVGLVSFFEGYSVAKNLPKSDGLSVGRELAGVGSANIVSSFFNGFSVSGGLSRTMVNVNSGATTQVSSLIAFLVSVFAILFLSSAMQYIPNSLLAAVICVAVLGMIKYEQLIETYKISKVEFFVSFSTLLMVIGIGAMYGIAYGVGISIVVSLYQLAIPHMAELGEMRGGLLRNLKRYPTEAKRLDGIIIIRLDAPIFYANAGIFFSYCRNLLKEREKDGKEKVTAFIVDASGVGWVDVSALHELLKFQKFLTARKIKLVMAEVRGPVRDRIERFNLATKNKVAPFYEHIPVRTHEEQPLTVPPSPELGPAQSAPKGPEDELTCFSVHTLYEALDEIKAKAVMLNLPPLNPDPVNSAAIV